MEEISRPLADDQSVELAPDVSLDEAVDGEANGTLDTEDASPSTELAHQDDALQGDLQRLAGQSVEVLSLYGQITGHVQQHLVQLAETAERLRQELDRETERVSSLRSERTTLRRDLDTLREERDTLRQDLERMVETGLARRRDLAAQIEQLERSREQSLESVPASRRPWWQFW